MSQAITRLAPRPWVRLVTRTTRRRSLTAEGGAFVERCQRLPADLEEAEDRGRGGQRTARPAAHPCAARFRTLGACPLAVEFLARHPEVTVDISIDDGATDPSPEGVDASFTLGEPTFGRVVAHQVCSVGYAVCASPDYLRVHGKRWAACRTISSCRE